MRGQPDRIDRGNLVDAFLRLVQRLGQWAGQRAIERMLARRAELALPSCTRIRINGECCLDRLAGKFGTIHSYIPDSDDYRILLDGDLPNNFGYSHYACRNGFEVLP